jgi:hypothetical protein
MSEVPARALVLESARKLITGRRQADYGPPAENFARVATIWSIILRQPVTADQVALCMAGLKLARLANGPHADSYVDLCGYGALAAELAGVSIEAGDKGGAV